MGHEPIKKNTKQKWVIIGVIFVIVLTVGCVTGLAIKRKPVQNAEDSMSAEENMSVEEKMSAEEDISAEENISAEDSMSAEDNMSKQTVLSVEISVEREKEFIEFEKLFRDQEDDLKKLAEELVNQNLLENQNYIIFFDEQSYDKDFLKLFYIDGTFKSGVKEELVEELKSIDFFTDYTDEEIDKILSSMDKILSSMDKILSSNDKLLSFNDAFKLDINEELVEILNENTALKEVLNSIIENGAIISIRAYTSGDMWILEFTVDPKVTPFFTGNYGFANAFQYCEDEGLENIYCHKKVEDNWYLWIKPVPDY